MNRSQLIRIAWKDYRRMSSLWYGMVVVWFLCVGFTTSQDLLYQSGSAKSPASSEITMLLIPFFTIIYALAWAAVTFSAEHEEGTYLFLRALPVDAKHVFYGKLCYGFGSTSLLGVALLATSLVARCVMMLQGVDVEQQSLADSQLFSIFLVSIIPLTLAAGIFWSLRVNRPLLSLVLTAITVMTIPPLTIVMADTAYRILMGNFRADVSVAHIVAIGLIMSTFSGILFWVARRLANSWFPNHSLPPAMPIVRSKAARSMSVVRGQFFRLLWLQAKQKSWLAVIGAGLVCCFLMLLTAEAPSPYGRFYTIFVAPFPLLGLAAFVGVTVFRAEHTQQRYRFLSQLGVNPTAYWWSRILLPLFLAMLVAAFSLPVFQVPNLYVVAGAIAAFGIGQLASLATTSTIVATAITIPSLIIAWGWLVLCMLCHIPLWLGGLPVIVLPLLASYLRVPRWFQQIGGWKKWLVPLVPIGLSVFVVPLASAMYRVYEIPTATLPSNFETLNVSTPETDGSRAYREVLRSLPNDPDASYEFELNMKNSFFPIWMTNHPDFIERLMSAIAKGGPIPEEFRQANGGRRQNGHEAFIMSATCLLLSANDALAAGEVNRSWDRYQAALELARHMNDGKSSTSLVNVSMLIEQAVYDRLVPWAMAEENSAANVERAAAFVDQYRRSQPDWKNAVIVDYQNLQRIWRDPVQLAEESRRESEWSSFVATIPWERARSKRLMKYYLAREYQQAADSTRVLPPINEHLANSTLFAEGTSQDWYPGAISHQQQVRRGTIYQLALIAYRLQHQKYPQDLSVVRVDGNPLPDDVFAPGKLLILADGPGAAPAAAPYLYPSHAETKSRPTTADGAGSQRHFLLPALGEWDAARFAERLKLSSSRDLYATANRQRQIETEVKDESETGTIETFANALAHVDPMDTKALLAERIRNILHSEELGNQLAMIEYLRDTGEPGLIKQFLPSLLKILDGENVAASALTAQLLEERIAADVEPFPAVAVDTMFAQLLEEWIAAGVEFDWRIELANHISLPNQPSFDDSLKRVPIRNPASGYYYERGAERGDTFPLEDAAELARHRKFRGVTGRLASAEVNPEFLVVAFPDLGPYWTSSSDSEEDQDDREVVIEYRTGKTQQAEDEEEE